MSGKSPTFGPLEQQKIALSKGLNSTLYNFGRVFEGEAKRSEIKFRRKGSNPPSKKFNFAAQSFSPEDEFKIVQSRVKHEPRCAVGIVDFNLEKGGLKHVGIRGVSQIEAVDQNRLDRFVAKYLGRDSNEWNRWFVENVVDPLDAMVQITPTSIVPKDVSFFKTGPNLASLDF